MIVHLVDGTYELFRHFYAVPPARNAAGEEIGAVRGVVRSMIAMLEDGATHLGVATDHVIESFRNDLYPGYKTGVGIDPALWSQFPLLEEALRALGVTVWALVEFEADDGLAAAAEVADRDARVEQVLICTPDKDLAQCVADRRVVQFDRRARVMRDEDGVVAKFGVHPASIPDWLALTGDSADGFPGLPGFGAKTAAALLGVYVQVEAIPDDPRAWEVPVRGADRLAATLRERREEVALYKTLATLRRDVEVGAVDDWRWTGPAADWPAWCARLEDDEAAARVEKLTNRS